MGHLIYAIEKKPTVITQLESYNKSLGLSFPLSQSHFDSAVFCQLSEKQMVAVIGTAVKTSQESKKKMSSGF